jgi:hypothetical protein
MPSYRGSQGRDLDFQPLTPQDVADIAAHVLSWRTEAAATAETTGETGSVSRRAP